MGEIKDYSLVRNGKVVNRIVADEAFLDTIRHEWDFITDDVTAQKGAAWDGEKFSPAEVSAPPAKQSLEDMVCALAKKVDEIGADVKAMKGGKV